MWQSALVMHGVLMIFGGHLVLNGVFVPQSIAVIARVLPPRTLMDCCVAALSLPSIIEVAMLCSSSVPCLSHSSSVPCLYHSSLYMFVSLCPCVPLRCSADLPQALDYVPPLLTARLVSARANRRLLALFMPPH
jgi:hypothetical protein